MMKKQHYMTRDERFQLEAMYRNKIPVADIARQLGFCRQTIYNELRRGFYIHTCDLYDEVRYSADKAQQIHDYNQTSKGRPLKIGCDHDYADFLERKILTDRFSPAAALAAARSAGFKTSICVSTLYSYISKYVFLHLTNKDLWYKPKRKKSVHPVQRIAHPKLPSISDRPEWINSRSELGHWEMDLIVGKSGSRPVLLTLTERCSRQELIFKLPDRRASTIRGVFDKLERRIPDFRQRFRSITTDNGSEFLQYEQLRQSIYGGTRFQIYYCHSYAAWEKGTNENHNRMIRRWFPKGTDFSRVSQKRIAAVEHWMNHYPRRILSWCCPADFALVV
ncbi:MAG: IS30 family transposase [Clostridiales bacterium]|nr:IS30 family transposase [Candidatus Cacconaster stercorequi]